MFLRDNKFKFKMLNYFSYFSARLLHKYSLFCGILYGLNNFGFFKCYYFCVIKLLAQIVTQHFSANKN